ncbi:hypothetical protein Pst134EA_021217 [Puccinia striiformis f. sp. tritici]|uniref:hypothetical protein n=1 Tax=Puccinia striiformis f. sp. tritici TaxID=168172 RepID=UPI0020075D33|nr:hypothetical protein Pst134EA_021217 [Puccinia striiformis f. sp. tritici]KAH9457334.1 hypothetical protein Pst134EA_021217 [Puccinia striiformis f. sp. tritici]
MAGRSKKCQRRPVSESSASSADSSDVEEVTAPTKQTRPARVLDVDKDSDDEESGIEEISDAIPPITKEQQAMDEQELSEEAHEVYTNQRSQCYASYNPPYISNRRDKNKRRMIAYPCKTCEKHIHRLMYDTSPTNLSKHVASCLKKQKDIKESQKLAAMGVSGTGDINPRDVAQLCAIWCAKGARPFSALGEPGHIGILHPMVVRSLPSQKVISSEIGRLYTAVQESLMESLQKHTGAIYLGLDAWQSRNGFDILGTVIYCWVRTGDGGFKLDAS